MNFKIWIFILIVGATANSKNDSENFRLPGDLIPEHYALRILTDLSTDFSYNGKVFIDFFVKSNCKKIVLHSKNIKIFENETKLEELETFKGSGFEEIVRRPKNAVIESKKAPIKFDVKEPTLNDGSKVKEKIQTEEDQKSDNTFEKSENFPHVVHLGESKISESTEHPFKKPGAESLRPVTQETKTSKPETTMTQMSTQESIHNQGFKEQFDSQVPMKTENSNSKPVKIQEGYSTLSTQGNVDKEQPLASSPLPSSLPAASTTDSKIYFEPLSTGTTETAPVSVPSVVITSRAPPVTHEPELASTVGYVHQPVPQSNERDSIKNFTNLKHEYEKEKDFLIIHLDSPLTEGKKYRLYLTYQGVLTDTLTGFHRVPYVKKNSPKSTWLASTVFEPNEARSAFPCFDEPGYKATFDVTLGHDKKFTALSNMPLKSTTPIDGRTDWQWSTFETTPRMSTYLVAFLISDLEYLTPRQNSTDSGSKVTYRFWSRHDVLYRTRYAMRIAPEMKNYLENLLEVRDVLPKHDFVALPSFISKALENWGLYSFAEKNLLFTPGFSSIFSKLEITQVLGHEIAHLWFGNMVTPKWWDQIWLSEGFSNFFEVIAADHVQPTWDIKTISVIFAYLKIFSYDALHSSHPLVPKLKEPNDLNEIFDSISYQKGFYLLRMLSLTLGQETFLSGVRNYLKTNLLSNVEEDDLWEALSESAHRDNALPREYHLKDLMRNWTRKTGYPIIEVIRNYDNQTATVTQRRFLRSKDDYEFRHHLQETNSEDTKWWIPLTYTTGSELNFLETKPKVWLSPEEESKTLTDMPSRDDFVLMNLDAAGLYRVNYDERNWALIISYLLNENSSEISVINRVQILDDLLDLARAGEVPYDTALDATSYLVKERHFLPWKAALSNFDFISRMMRSTEGSRAFKKFLRGIVAPRFDELGFEPAKDESLSDGLNRKQIVKWACKTGLRQCTRKSLQLFKRWTEEKKPDENNPIPGSLRSTVYCTAIENGGAKDWQFLWQRYLHNAVTDKTAILYGLGCSKSTRTLKKYLDWSIKESSGIKKQDVPIVFKSVVRNDAGFSLAKNFLKERLGDIKKYLGNNPFFVPQMIETMAAKMNQPSDLLELEELEQEHYSKLRSTPRSFRQATERVRFNINWLEKNYQPVTEWLKRQKM